MKIEKNKKNGFSLVELLIVVTLITMMMLAASSVFLTFLISSSKLSSNQLIKQEGQYALAQMEFLLRNAIELEPNNNGVKCSNNMNQIKLRSLDGNTTTLMAETDDEVTKIASNSGTHLTSNSVNVENGPVFNCTQNSTQDHPHIELEFTLKKSGMENSTQQKFKTSTTVRSL